MGDKERLVLRAGEGGSLAIGVIRGNGYAELNAPPAEDEEVLLPQLELRLPPPVHGLSSSPRTVKSRVNNNAFVA